MKIRLAGFVVAAVLGFSGVASANVSNTPNVKYKGKFVQATFIRVLDSCVTTTVTVYGSETIYLGNSVLDNGPQLVVSLLTYDSCTGTVLRDALGNAIPDSVSFGNSTSSISGWVTLTDAISHTSSTIQVALTTRLSNAYSNTWDIRSKSADGSTRYSGSTSSANVISAQVNDGLVNWAAAPSTSSAEMGSSTGLTR